MNTTHASASQYNLLLCYIIKHPAAIHLPVYYIRHYRMLCKVKKDQVSLLSDL